MKHIVTKLQEDLQASEFTNMLVWDCRPQWVEGSKLSLAAPWMGVAGTQTWHQDTLQGPSRYSHCPVLHRPRPCEAENATLFGGTQPRVHTARDFPKLHWKHGVSFIQQPMLPSQALVHCSHALLSPGSGTDPSCQFRSLGTCLSSGVPGTCPTPHNSH